ncbi:hypothetical protein LZP97_17725 [Rhodococcus sp. DMF-1]|nr:MULTISPECIES: hypothetical protein [Rhodococcus]UIR35472.1 hypothetical protein LZP97_17725 [Rhodococcus sp. DMF-1]WKK10460.1 hypothetical protein QYN14_17185 [Rhodococcus ruber]
MTTVAPVSAAVSEEVSEEQAESPSEAAAINATAADNRIRMGNLLEN